MKLTLFNYWRSTSSWRVRIGLELKGLPYEYAAVNLLQGEQFSEAHRHRNPTGQVPVLEADGQLLGQSLAILEFLDETHPTPPLLPKDPFARARARQIAETINSGIQPYQNLSFSKVVGDRGKEIAQKYIGDGLGALEVLVGEGPFCVGDAPTIADCCLIPQLAGARRFHVDVAKFARLLSIEAACAKLPAFQRAHADAQPDVPKETTR